ncbi:murein biosynthesis protein MurJ [Micrococcus porci]|uniref:murein biosynthesis integral membrane protein MurJ n=1 Tax=Micrococcus porci TaxID=2856555 RepID=UPI001CCD1536|nr:lipid II flippase MurJ [Micrococcus porci]UBH24982.1 murein biosynthesis protein MurJ [Micrococcus porci]
MSSRTAPRRALPADDAPRPKEVEDVVLPASDPEAPAQAQEEVPEGERRAGRSTAIMAAGTMISRVLGFVRAALLTIAIGTTVGTVADIFEVANSLPNVIYLLLVGGVFNVVLVPQLIKHAKDADRGADYTSRLMTLAVLVMLAATVLVTAAAAPLMAALTRGWSPEMLQLGTVFALWCLPQMFFYGMYALVGQILNANGRFGAYMWAPVLNNVVAIAAIGLYLVMFGRYSGGDLLGRWTPEQTLVLAGGHTLGVILQALILFLPLRGLGLGLRPRFGWRGMGLRHTGRIAGYTLFTMAASNIVLLLSHRYINGASAAREDPSVRVPGTEGWDPAMADALIPGLTAYNQAMLISVLPHSVFVLSLATVLFNKLARSMAAGDHAAVRETTARGLRTFAAPIMFSLAGVVVLAGPLGRLFGSTAESAQVTGMAVGAVILLMSLSMPFRSGSFYLLRVFYAAESARIPMVVQVTTSLLTLAVTAAGAYLLPLWAITYWAALASVVSHAFQFFFAHVLAVRRFGDYGFTHVLAAYATTGAAGVVAGAAGAVVAWLLGAYSGGWAWGSILSALVTCAVVGLVMAPVYVVALRVLRFPELASAAAPLARRVPALGRLLGAR